jgi:hypothetical protein
MPNLGAPDLENSAGIRSIGSLIDNIKAFVEGAPHNLAN